MKDGAGQTAYQALYDMIANGQLESGDHLGEIDLAKRIGVSRTPIREAIRRLEVEGIVSHEPRAGAVVKSLSQREVVELYEMRIVLEATAAEMAARHASLAETRTLETLNDQMLNAGKNAAQVAEINRQFHNCIVNAARNRYLASSYRNLANALVVLGHTTLDTSDRVISVFTQHQAIIGALVNRDALAAREAMIFHMETSLDHRLMGLK